MVDLDAPGAPPAPAARRFKGWQVVAASFTILFVSSGLGFYSLAVYLDALTDDGQFTVGQVSVANFLFFLTAGVAGLLAARLIARFDVRLVAAAGGALAAVCLGMIGLATHLWSLYVVYIVFGIGWALCGMVPATTVVTRWFHRRRSLALSVASTGLSVGGIVITPFVKTAIESHGMAAVMPWLGVLFAVGTIPVALFALLPWPQLYGQLPDGDPPVVAAEPPAESAATLGSAAAVAAPEVGGVDFHIAVRSRFFVLITAAYVLVMAAQVGGISHLVKLATGRIDKPTAALVLSVMAGASVVARLAGGWIVSRVPMTGFTAALALLQGVALASLGWLDTRTGLLVMAVAFGTTVGNLLMLQPLLMAEAFGVRDYPRIYSRSQFVSTVGVALGPLLLGLVHDGVDGYEFPYTLAALMSMAGSAMILAAGPTPTAAARAEDQAARRGVTGPARLGAVTPSG